MAGTGSNSGEGAKEARIEIIPLIDVIFFLLATFVLFTLSLDRIQSIPVNLPVSDGKPQPPNPNDETVTLQISDQGACYWTYQKVTELVDITEIVPKLQNYVAHATEPRVLLTTDDRGKYGVAIQVLDEVRNSGITKVSIDTRQHSTGR